MNTKSITKNRTIFLIFYLFLGNSLVWAETFQVTWSDSSNDEDGFIIEKRTLSDSNYELRSIVTANTTFYIDDNVIANETYCYRVASYNESGFNYSSEACYEVQESSKTYDSGNVDSEVDVIETDSTISTSHEFIDNSESIEIGDKKFYSFRNDQVFNSDYSESNIENVEFDVSTGSINYSDRDYFSFQRSGVDLAIGYVSMPFSTESNMSFNLQTESETQTATIYILAGAWSNESSSIIVTAGNKVETITLPSGYTWHYFSVDISFNGEVPVSISTNNDQSGYSSVKVTGIVFNDATEEQNTEVDTTYAELVSIDSSNQIIDISDSKYVTYNSDNGNNDLSDASLASLSYDGISNSYTTQYSFIENGTQSYTGYQRLSWNPSNAVLLQLESADQQINTVSLYFTAGAWTNDDISIDLLLNGESHDIDISSGYSWRSIKVDIEFEGELSIEIRPVGTFTGYSALLYAGLTLN